MTDRRLPADTVSWEFANLAGRGRCERRWCRKPGEKWQYGLWVCRRHFDGCQEGL